MKHSEPNLYIFIVLCSITIIILSIINVLVGVFTYFYIGLLIWIVCGGEPSFIKTILFWYVAILFDKREWIE
jgi:hypothetical protein